MGFLARLATVAQPCSRDGGKARSLCSCRPRLASLEAELTELRIELEQSQKAIQESTNALHAERHSWEQEKASIEARVLNAQSEIQAKDDALAVLNRLNDTMSALVVTVDGTGRITELNKKASQVLGFDLHQKLRLQFEDFLHVDDRPGLACLTSAVLASGGTSALEGMNMQHRCRLRPLEGWTRSSVPSWDEVLLSASPWRNAEGAVEYVVFVGQDLTAFGRTLLEAERSAEDSVELLQSVNAPIIGTDPQGLVNEWNKKAEWLTGYSQDEVLGRALVQQLVPEEQSDSVQTMLSLAVQGQDITNYEFPLFTKGGQRREILWSSRTRRDRDGKAIGVIGIGQDITELRSESKMLANYVRICGAAVWSLRGHASTGAVTESKTKEIENLISQQSQMDICDPRMVLWRASFVSILKTMCQNFWMRRKDAQGRGDSSANVPMMDFGYEFCFESPNGQVKWYKVEGHLISERSTRDGQFEVTGSMQEVTEMWIDKVMGDKRSSMWSRMCHMVFDATLLVDTQEYRVLNAWGEEKVFGCKLQSNHPVLQLFKSEDAVAVKEAFNEVTLKGFERGRTLHLLRQGLNRSGVIPAQCFLLAADQENPNECMMGIRMQVSGTAQDCSEMWDVSKPNPVLTLDDLARLKSGLKRHRRPSRPHLRSGTPRQHRPRSVDPHTSSHSLSSIPEDLHGEDGEDEEEDMRSASGSGADSAGGADTESLQSSSKSSTTSSKSSNGSISAVGVCNTSSPPQSASDIVSLSSREPPVHGSPVGRMLGSSRSPKLGALPKSTSPPPFKRRPLRMAPPRVKLRWKSQSFDLNLDDFISIGALRLHCQELTGVPACRQTLILAGRRLGYDDEPADPAWAEIKASVRVGQPLMLIGSAPPPGEGTEVRCSAAASSSASEAREARKAVVVFEPRPLIAEGQVSPEEEEEEEDEAHEEPEPSEEAGAAESNEEAGQEGGDQQEDD